MSYIGKYTDRNPSLVAAGVHAYQPCGVKELLVYASLDDKVTALKHHYGIYDEKDPALSAPPSYPLPPDGGTRYEDLYNQMKDIVSPPPRTLFQQVQDEFQETCYDSYWNAPLGKSRYQAINLPNGFNPLTTTLGKPTDKSITAGELVSPPKLPGQVLFEDSIGHDLYVRTHKDYAPGEQVNRNYVTENFDPKRRFGGATPSDERGIWVPKCLYWFNNEPFTVASNKQADAILHGPQIGQCLLREEVLGNLVPKNHTFGIPTLPSDVSVKELLQNSDPCYEKRDEAEYLSHINAVRRGLQKDKEFKWKDFLALFRFTDKQHSGWLPLSKVYQICQSYRVNFDKPLLEMLLKRLGILCGNGCVNYLKFVEILDVKYAFPDLPDRIEDIPVGNLEYRTLYRTSYETPGYTDEATAGVPSVRNDLKYPQAEINALKESLGDETNVPTLINPSFFTRYGLSHRDFFKPRSQEAIRLIFTNIGVKFPDGAVERLYEEGLKLDNTGGVCVETFRNLLERLCARRLEVKICE